MIFEENAPSESTDYTFIIDGNYLAMRIGFGVQLDFKEDPEKHSIEFYKALCMSFSNLISDYRESIGKVMIVMDGRSWRKDVEMIVPTLRESIPKKEQQYKANRNKDEMAIDVDVVMKVFNSFVDMLDSTFNVPVIRSSRAEGDDLLYIVSEEENKLGNKCLLYTSDGDIPALVSDKVFVLKQMPNDRPNKLIVSSSKRAEMYSNKTVVEDDKFHMFGNIETKKKDYLLSKFSEEDTLTINAPELLFLKSISGDKKDNIHPTFLWFKKDGSGMTKEYKPTGMYIKKGLEVMGKTVDDLEVSDLYDRNFYVHLLNNTLRATPLYPKITDVMRSYKNNLKYLLENEKYSVRTPFELARIAVCGNGTDDCKPCMWVEDEKENTHTPLPSDVEGILRADDKENMTLKDLKSNKFPKPFLLKVIKELPRVRNLSLMVKIFEQNVRLLHLNKISIPESVITESLISYERKKDVVCDLNIVTNFNSLIQGIPSSSGIFNGFVSDGEQTKEKETPLLTEKETKNILQDTDNIMASVFGDGY